MSALTAKIALWMIKEYKRTIQKRVKKHLHSDLTGLISGYLIDEELRIHAAIIAYVVYLFIVAIEMQQLRQQIDRWNNA